MDQATSDVTAHLDDYPIRSGGSGELRSLEAMERKFKIGLDAFSKHNVNSPGVARVIIRYMGIRAEWGNDRITKLCHTMSCPLHYICIMAGMVRTEKKSGRIVPDYGKMVSCWESGEWPMTVLLHFRTMETVMQARMAADGAKR
jgi:hypothetical protein